MLYDAQKEWTRSITNVDMAWPSEYVIRMFKGQYPNLDLRSVGYENKKICDVGCGDGRNIVVLKEIGFDVSGVEISDDIISQINGNLKNLGIEGVDVKKGANHSIPFENEYFDFLMSWNACYYMGQNSDFMDYVAEFARVLKSGGTFVFSIPKETCFIYKNSEVISGGYRIIREDPFGVRNGEKLKCFQSAEEIKETFSQDFEAFTFGDIHDDCFGYNYHWYIGSCVKK
jgi:ubiquinone/menaquinone biosynthesis C-methylase UbiE